MTRNLLDTSHGGPQPALFINTHKRTSHTHAHTPTAFTGRAPHFTRARARPISIVMTSRAVARPPIAATRSRSVSSLSGGARGAPSRARRARAAAVSTGSARACAGGGCSGPAGGAAAAARRPAARSCSSSGRTPSSAHCAGCSGCTSPPAPSCTCGRTASASGAAAAGRSAARSGLPHRSLPARREMSLTSLPADGDVSDARPSRVRTQLGGEVALHT